uniref:Uncharacterized protein n=1 Tax=Anopheles atroparvus TaxID=41427 RepID=A0A182J1N3_ANOAO
MIGSGRMYIQLVADTIATTYTTDNTNTATTGPTGSTDPSTNDCVASSAATVADSAVLVYDHDDVVVLLVLLHLHVAVVFVAANASSTTTPRTTRDIGSSRHDSRRHGSHVPLVPSMQQQLALLFAPAGDRRLMRVLCRRQLLLLPSRMSRLMKRLLVLLLLLALILVGETVQLLRLGNDLATAGKPASSKSSSERFSISSCSSDC